METISNFFDGKALYADTPSCGFDEEIAIKINNDEQIFCIACDFCPRVYWVNKDSYVDVKLNMAVIFFLGISPQPVNQQSV